MSRLLDIISRNSENLSILKKYYEAEKLDKNNFSYWYDKIKGIKEFIIPQSRIVDIPFDVWMVFNCDAIEDNEYILKDFVDKELVPFLDDDNIYFVKNAKFSNKFNYNTCITNRRKLLDSFINICYSALCLGAEGNTEFIIRDYIPYDANMYATIYNGLPLRCEIRVFYDADSKQVLYPVNYWDYEYCRSKLYSRGDQIIFDSLRTELEQRYQYEKIIVCNKVEQAFENVDLEGKWSIDIMIDDSNFKSEYYLIDMALAENSAYWNNEENELDNENTDLDNKLIEDTPKSNIEKAS